MLLAIAAPGAAIGAGVANGDRWRNSEGSGLVRTLSKIFEIKYLTRPNICGLPHARAINTLEYTGERDLYSLIDIYSGRKPELT